MAGPRTSVKRRECRGLHDLAQEPVALTTEPTAPHADSPGSRQAAPRAWGQQAPVSPYGNPTRRVVFCSS